jgi:23S rRNA pseudouridine955/2504/2580 synthase
MSWGLLTMNKLSSGVSHVEVSPARDGQRLDNFLSARLKGVPRSVIYRIIRTGQVRVNGKRAKPALRLEAGDSVRIPPATSREDTSKDIPPAVCRLLAASVLYEDQDLLVVDKPAGMAVHAGSGLAWGVVDVIRQLRPASSVDLVHRLDRETSGCLILALNGEALRDLNQQVKDGRMDKRYLCLLDGRLDQARTEVDEPIGQYERAGQKFMRVDMGGKPAHTTFRLLNHFGSFSYAEAELHSGRTHQIRVHAAYINMPLAGDNRYSPGERLKYWRQRGLKRLFLHAHQVSFQSMNGEPQLVNSPLPDDLRDLLGTLP